MVRLFLTSEQDSRLLEFSQSIITIGRDEGSAIRLRDRRASRHHARIERTGNEVRLVDLGSQNGTWVNHRRVTSTTLWLGDEICIGGACLTVVELSESPQAVAAAPREVREERPAAVPQDQEKTLPVRRIRRRILPPRPLAHPATYVLLGLAILASVYGPGLFKAESLAPLRAPGRPARGPSAPPRDTARHEAEERLLAFRRRCERAPEITEALLAEGERLAEENRPYYPAPGDPEGTPYDRTLAELKRRRQAELGSTTVSRVQALVQEALRDRRYGAALRALKSLGAQGQDLTFDALTREIADRIQEDFQVVHREGERLEEDEQFDLATLHYREHAPRFEGTEYQGFFRDLLKNLEARSKASGADDP